MGQIPGFIKWGASLFFVMAMITIGFLVFTPSTEAGKIASSEFSTVTSELKDQKFLIYDNATASGSSVVNALRNYKAAGEEGSIAVQVKTGKNPGGTWYYNIFNSSTGITTGGGDTTNVNESTHVEYINPSGNFKAKVERDKNSVIRALIFTQM
ncbi:hypothetical protein [Sporosarcina sp. FSL K6-1508]|uniref:hypothetical protein n=1 Tax=Sporosarcina sp. FSL K6-1508 TaxID=2921553 RepID=UPI0030F966D7